MHKSPMENVLDQASPAFVPRYTALQILPVLPV
jgi:hypothetical protein